MPTPAEKLAESLRVLKGLQDDNGLAIIKSDELSRTHRDRLLENGFIQEVMKGWYISRNPHEQKGESTSWYTSFWSFCSVYLNERFGDNWCLSPEHSVAIHSGSWTIPQQLIVRSPSAGNNVTKLLFGISLVDAALAMPAKNQIVEKNKVRIYSLPAALVSCSPEYFSRNSIDVRTALASVKDSSDILRLLLDGGSSTIAGRLVGAFRNINNERIAEDIIKTMKSAGYDIRETDPFEKKSTFYLSERSLSPYANRIKVMWEQMRDEVLKNFPKAPGLPKDKKSYLKRVEDFYKTDAYHSLSIEGYQVTTELIERVKSGDWNPGKNELDKEFGNALAARGYYLAFEEVKKSIDKIFTGENPGKVADDDHRDWYRSMFTPSVTAGLIKSSDLAGYRNSQVFISESSHIPFSCEGARDAMPALFELLQKEGEPCVRAVLGHFIFVYIHPYMDGNGRLGRFLMNVMLASGGYPWTVIPVNKRNEYMSALEKASVGRDIKAFTKFIAKHVLAGLRGKPIAKL